MDQWLQTVPAWIYDLPSGLRTLMYQLYQTFIAADRWKWFANGLKITFAVTIGALILGVIIGMVIAVIRTAHDSRRAGKGSIILNILNAVCKLYLTIIRGTPMMVQLLIMGFVIMVPKDDTARMVCGIVTLGINSGAYVAEIVRGGLMSVGAGQMEAGRDQAGAEHRFHHLSAVCAVHQSCGDLPARCNHHDQAAWYFREEAARK